MMGNKKKVLYVITKGNLGGAQRYVFDLSTNLPKEEFEAVVAFGEGESLKKKLESCNIRTIEIQPLKRDVKMFSDIASLFALLKIIKAEKPDILHLNSSKAGGLGSLAGRLLGVSKIIFTGHGWAFNEERSIFSKIFILKLYWWIIMLSHKTIAVSERTRDQVIWMPFLKKRISVVYNGVDPFELLSKEDARGVLMPNVTERLCIGTISELHNSKGLDFLLEAFAGLSKENVNTALVIVGSGEEKEELEKLTKTLGITSKVTFTGFVADARKYLNAFDVFTLTSRTEAFPYTILEAGLAKLPVVASWVGGIPEIITNEESGLLVVPSDIEKLCSTIGRLSEAAALRTTLGETLCEKVKTSFTIERMVRETILLY